MNGRREERWSLYAKFEITVSAVNLWSDQSFDIIESRQKRMQSFKDYSWTQA